MATTTTFHPAPPGWRAAMYVGPAERGAAPGWCTVAVIGWAATVTERTDPYGTPDGSEDDDVWVRPVVFHTGDVYGETEPHGLLCIIEPHEDPTAPEGIDELVAAEHRRLEARRAKAAQDRSSSGE